MREKYAQIWVRENEDPVRDKRWRTYRWVGKKHWKTALSYEILFNERLVTSIEIGKVFNVGPYELKILDVEYRNKEVICMRTDAILEMTMRIGLGMRVRR